MDWNIWVGKGPAPTSTWAVYGSHDGKTDLLEGGFFSKARAEESAASWREDCLQNEVEKAELKAGWDPNP